MKMLASGTPIDHSFLRRNPVDVARGLLGCGIAHRVEGQWLGGWIVETEAYLDQDDLASHSSRGPTPGNASMFLRGGTLYVYPIHAKYCMNIVTQESGVGSAVLIRAIEPRWGVEIMQQNRGVTDLRRLTSGPGMICQAMQVDRSSDGIDLILSRDWQLTAEHDVQSRLVACSRIGIRHAAELPLRFFIDGNRYVSGLARLHTRPRREELQTRDRTTSSQEQMPEKSNILDPSHSIPRRTSDEGGRRPNECNAYKAFLTQASRMQNP